MKTQTDTTNVLPLNNLMEELLNRFRQCDNYTDKLALWEEYNLTGRLFYNIYEADRETAFAFNTWEDVKKLPILTLTPFTFNEAEQFIQWALRIRPGVNEHVSTFEQRRDFVQNQYNKVPSTADKQFFLDSYGRQIENMKRSNFDHYGLDYAGIERIFQIDVSHYTAMIILLRLGESVPLARWVWQAENLHESHRMNWNLIDTYLLAKGVIDTSIFLEQFNPASNNSIDVQPPKQSSLTARQRALLAVFQGNVVERGNGDNNLYNHYIKLCKTSDRLGFINESRRKVNDLINDYKSILIYLTPEQKKHAETEMNTILPIS